MYHQMSVLKFNKDVCKSVVALMDLYHAMKPRPVIPYWGNVVKSKL